MSNKPLKLIKDLDNYKFVYYWASPDSGKVSPELPTLLHASEWLVEYQADKYQDSERRESRIDRRKRERHASSPGMELIYSRRLNPEGRRVTDKLPVIDLDMTSEKFNKMKDELMN